VVRLFALLGLLGEGVWHAATIGDAVFDSGEYIIPTRKSQLGRGAQITLA
jgi:hypothetical protein